MKIISSLAIIIFLICLSTITNAQKNPEAFVLLDTQGKSVKWNKAIKELSGADIVLFGELHDDPIAHWLQLQLLNDLYEIDSSNLILGAEMFERDNQLIIDEYLDDLIDDKRFEEGLNLWKNYKTDYK